MSGPGIPVLQGREDVKERAVKSAGAEDVEGAAHGLAEAVRTSYGDEGAAYIRGEDDGGTGND